MTVSALTNLTIGYLRSSAYRRVMTKIHAPTRAIIYCRVSSDRSGRGRSVSEQEDECRRVCEREGWPVAEVLVDNDIGASRHSGKDRPEFKRLADVLRAGDVLVTWEASRATRDLKVYVELRDLCAERGVWWSYSGNTYDMSSGSDRWSTGLDALVAEKAAEETRDRVLRALEKNADQGLPHGRIPYGYRGVRDPGTGKIVERVIEPSEASIIREIAERLLAGQTAYSIAVDLNDRDISTGQPSRAGWTTTTILRLVQRPYLAGKRTHRGKLTQGTWEPILTEDQQLRLSAIINNRPKPSRGSEPRSLLSGTAMCGVCGWPMYRYLASAPSKPAYRCSNRPHHTSRDIEKTDAVVIEKLIEAINNYRDDLTLRVSEGDAADQQPDVSEFLNQAREAKQRLDALQQSYIAGKTAVDDWEMMSAAIREQIETANSRAQNAAVTSSPLLAIINTPAEEMWEMFTFEEQRRFVRAAVEVKIHKPPRRGTRFDRELIEVTLRR